MSEKNNFNYGIALFKLAMCFEVVLGHFWRFPKDNFPTRYDMLLGLIVPSFLFLAFYFSANTFTTADDAKIKKRIWRLVYPQIGWAVIYWIVLMILQIRISSGITFTDLLWQIATGHSQKLNPSMWYQSVLIALTFIYIIVFRFVSAKKGLLIILSMALVSVWFQYSGLNHLLCESLRYELKFPLRRFFEMIPFAALGYIVSYFNVFNRFRLNENRTMYIVVFGILFLLIFIFRLIPLTPGYGFFLNENNLLGVFVATIFAYLLPLEKLPEKMRSIIMFVTKYTYGIYCMHRLVALVLGIVMTVLKIELSGFIYCIVIYSIAFCVSHLMSISSCRYLKQLVE